MAKCFRTVYAKYRWLLLGMVWITVYLTLRHVEHSIDRQAKETKAQLQVFETNKTEITQYDAILNSYMRSGSTLLGLVLGFRNDTFYVYEPLWKLSRWTYWRGNSTVCRLDRPECRHTEPDMEFDAAFANNKNTNSSGASLFMARKILRKLYDCLFNDTERTMVEEGLTVKIGGPSWEKVKSCIKTYKKLKYCLHKHAPEKCKRSRHKIAKVLRLTVDNLEPILKERDNMKVIHLFRDPRAIINSRIETGWYPTKNKSDILNNARSLCSKMMYDFEAGVKLQEKYPHRFRFIYYEDFTAKPLDKAKALYRYLGMSLDKAHYTRVTQVTIFHKQSTQTEREKNSAFWWRKTLSWETVQEIDAICNDVINNLGYTRFNSEDDLRNLSLASVDIPKNCSLVIQ